MSDEEEEVFQEVVQAVVLVAYARRRQTVDTDIKSQPDTPRRSANRPRDRVSRHKQIMKDYFIRDDEQQTVEEAFVDGNMTRVVRGPLMSNEDFETSFRVSRGVFARIFAACCGSPFFQQKPDAVGLLGATPEQKMVAAMRQIAYGVCPRAQMDYTGLSERTARDAAVAFCDAVIDHFAAEYLRYPSPAELKKIESRFRRTGFPGAIGAIDCSGWQWKNCPTAWHGIFKGKEHVANVRMEVWSDIRTRIWSFHYGAPGAENDIQILRKSPLYSSIMNGVFDLKVPASLPVTIGQHRPKYYYFLADGIYPDMSIFVKSLPDRKRLTQAHRIFCARQEAVRKCIERTFGILFSRFHILAYPCKYISFDKMRRVAKACAILHNMVIEEKFPLDMDDELDDLDNLESGITLDADFGNLNADEASNTVLVATRTVEEQFSVWVETTSTIFNDEATKDLQNALIEHIANERHQ